MQVADLKHAIREIPDFPKPGIKFYDVSTLFRDPAAFRTAIDHLVDRYRDRRPDAIAGIEARGFVLASAMAYRLGCGLVMVRKFGKLPGRTVGQNYQLEYGEAHLEMHDDALEPGQRVLIVDDLLATGGTAAATGQLVERVGGQVLEYAFLVELDFLAGRDRIGRERVFSLLHYGQ